MNLVSTIRTSELNRCRSYGERQMFTALASRARRHTSWAFETVQRLLGLFLRVFRRNAEALEPITPSSSHRVRTPRRMRAAAAASLMATAASSA